MPSAQMVCGSSAPYCPSSTGKVKDTFSPSILRTEPSRRHVRSSTRMECWLFAKSAKTVSAGATSEPAPRVEPHVPVPHGVISSPPRMKPNGATPAHSHGPEPAISSTSVALPAPPPQPLPPQSPKAPGRRAGSSGCMIAPLWSSRLSEPGARASEAPESDALVAEKVHGAAGSAKASTYVVPHTRRATVPPGPSLQVPWAALLTALSEATPAADAGGCTNVTPREKR
mmetsp:Transcript_12903/g.42209  ORF Transcript_12903/g.42209 Transcript_12903/m.42209 type:complete len:228 (+) Transcript_12903:279-962(+)